jgi:hypothetical protein
MKPQHQPPQNIRTTPEYNAVFALAYDASCERLPDWARWQIVQVMDNTPEANRIKVSAELQRSLKGWSTSSWCSWYKPWIEEGSNREGETNHDLRQPRSVVHDTLRDEDLLNAFSDALEDLITRNPELPQKHREMATALVWDGREDFTP